MRRTLLALPLLLAGCAGAWPSGSYVQGINPEDARILAAAVADAVAAILPSKQDVHVQPAGHDDPIAVLLPPFLDRADFTETRDGIPVSYVAVPMDDGIMLRVSIDTHNSASRYFVRTSTRILTPGGPLTVGTIR
jgi:hypothetical protein